ncbi:hypothetical protein [Actinotalea sp. Marseille-Q4924]|uniref:hypothetical protein n=1 Tax=Actinotalea sp. Marseille-Q4924 TaxID=2866571 RepID=UPI001CE3DD18|nr:hypothetical protein [Actinotalea sp. Marseille-Q4924]
MVNALLTSDKIASVAAALVGQDLGLAGLVYRDVDRDLGDGSGDTVKVRVPGALASQTRGVRSLDPLIRGEIREQHIAVTLTDEVYDQIPLARGTLDLDLVDFSKQILVPQASAIVRHIERTVAAAMSATPETTTITYDPAAPAKTFTQIRKALRDNGVTAETPLLAAVGSSVYGDLLDAEALDGDTVRGFRVYESTRLAAEEIVGFVEQAFALAVRAPIAPEGAPYSASVKEGGFALTHVRAFDPTIGADTSLVSTLIGCRAMPLAVDNEDGTVTLTPHAGAVRVVTAA